MSGTTLSDGNVVFMNDVVYLPGTRKKNENVFEKNSTRTDTVIVNKKKVCFYRPRRSLRRCVLRRRQFFF